MSEPQGWAILRQLVLATPEAVEDGIRIGTELGLPPGFADPLLAEIALADYVMPVGTQKYLEFVGPLSEAAYINRWLGKVGSGGYCLSVQVPDSPACKERALALGVRMAADQLVMGHPIIQLHPADVGVLLELDGITDPQAWFWDDVTPGPNSDAAIDDILAVTVGVPDPAATTAQWAEIIGLVPTSPTSLDFSGCTVEFVENPVGQVLSATFQLADGRNAPDRTDLHGVGVAFRSAASVAV